MNNQKQPLEGQPASPYIKVGIVTKSNDGCIGCSKHGIPTILVKEYTTPEDMIAIDHCEGIVTVVGGMSSHAAIIAREFKKACIINCSDADSLEEGETVTVDGVSGKVYRGDVL